MQQDNWRFCTQCGGLFWNGSSHSRCPRDGGHRAGTSLGIVLEPTLPLGTVPDYVLDHDIATDVQHQDGWRYCVNCAGIFWELATAAEVVLFDPVREGALGVYMDVDPTNPHKGFAYGPYPLEAYTTWDPRNRLLDLYYLLSLSNPYQVQVMHTRIRIPAS